MKKLWEKKTKHHSLAEAYCFGGTAMLDNKLITYDVLGSIAHAKMLSTIEILTQKEFLHLKKHLLEIIDLEKEGKFTVTSQDEDVHTKIENYLTEKLGDVGKKIHTGRSRNDQVLVDLRLYAKEYLFAISTACNSLTQAFLSFANKYERIPMPGYTHMQKAMPSSVGLWAGSFAESLVDDLTLLKAAYNLNDQSPLGSGASYGISLPIDRDLTAKLLGFAKVQNNTLYCQVSRPKFQLAIMHALAQMMLTLSRFAQDLLLFTIAEFKFFTVSEDLCTGSSIMPQKKNLDVMEIVRARTHMVIALEQSIATIAVGLPSGYNADFGETKEPFMKAIEIVLKTLQIVELTLHSLTPNVEILKKSCTPELFATHYAYLLVKQGMPFREAYKKVAFSLNDLPNFDIQKVLKLTNHVGGPGNLQLEKIQKILKRETVWWKKRKENFTKTISRLMGGE